MEVKFISIPVGAGDCLCLILENDGEKFSIMIDCGKYNPAVKSFVHDYLKLHIDLLIITHIDNDHVCGVTQLIDSEPDLYIGEILFNSYQREPIKDSEILTEDQKRKIKKLKGELDIIVDITENSKINAEDAKLLSETILKYEKSNKKEIWKRAYTSEETANLKLGDKSQFGELVFLSPSVQNLKELDKEFIHMFKALFYPKNENDSVVNSSIFELIIQYINLRDTNEFNNEKISATPHLSKSFFTRLMKEKATDNSFPNRASMAFTWTYNGIPRMLFLGDASHEQVCKGLNDKYPGKHLIFDLIKISHHGSKGNTSEELMNLVDSDLYVIPGGRTNGGPSYETIAKILMRPLPPQLTQRTLLFSKSTNIVNDIKNNIDKLSFIPQFNISNDATPINFSY